MALGQGDLKSGFQGVLAAFKRNPTQLCLVVFMVMMCGATKKFQTFPMAWIAGQSKCQKIIDVSSIGPLPKWAESTYEDNNTEYAYTMERVVRTEPGCKEKAKVFVQIRESFAVTTANLIFFGIVKAIFNFVTGVCCDKWGRKWTLTAGWVLAIPMPFMVIFAGSWWTAAASNIFLGMQQALVWSATIFIMVDYFGSINSGAAIGLNETVGYTTIAIVTKIAAAIMDEDEPRTTCYFIVCVLIGAGILMGALLLKESKPIADQEEAIATHREEQEVAQRKECELKWPSGRTSTVTVGRAAFVYTSFVNTSTFSICVAGLMINFISGFAWGLFKKWMKDDYVVDGSTQWDALSKETIANIVLCYGLPKGVLQMFFGFLGDRFGRKWFIVGGLLTVSLGLFILAITGESSSDPRGGFVVGALFMGIGTGIMYTNNLAAIIDHADASWRSSSLGSYRFWRDLGYAVGALLTGLFADAFGIGGSVIMTGILTTLAAINVALLYQEVKPGDDNFSSVVDGKSAEESPAPPVQEAC